MLGRELKGMGIDQMGRRAMEEGFLMPGDADSAEPDYGRMLVAALQREMSGDATYRASEQPDTRMDQLREELDRLGIDLSTMTNDEVFALMQEASEGDTFQQASAEEFLVTSPGGTAIAGLHTIEAGGLRTTLMDAVEAATQRSRQLGEQAVKTEDR